MTRELALKEALPMPCFELTRLLTGEAEGVRAFVFGFRWAR